MSKADIFFVIFIVTLALRTCFSIAMKAVKYKPRSLGSTRVYQFPFCQHYIDSDAKTLQLIK